MSADRPCDLCALPVGIAPFALRTPTQELQFCCEACRSIYEMLHDIGQTPGQNTGTPTNTR